MKTNAPHDLWFGVCSDVGEVKGIQLCHVRNIAGSQSHRYLVLSIKVSHCCNSREGSQLRNPTICMDMDMYILHPQRKQTYADTDAQKIF